jgi:hypothetical protein
MKRLSCRKEGARALEKHGRIATAARYYQKKFRLSKEAKVAQHFTGPVSFRTGQHCDTHKEFPKACAPFVQTRTGPGIKQLRPYADAGQKSKISLFLADP